MAGLVHQHLYQKHIDLHLSQAVKGFVPVSGPDPLIRGPAERRERSGSRYGHSVHWCEAGYKSGKTGRDHTGPYRRHTREPIPPDLRGKCICRRGCHRIPPPVSGEPWLNYLAGPANRRARIVADNMVFGDRIAYEGSIGTSIAKVFDLTVGSTGLRARN